MTKQNWMGWGVLILAVSLPSARAGAQAGGPYDLTWNAIECGGGASAGGTLGAYISIGQPVIGAASGGTYWLEGGFGEQGLAPAGAEEPRSVEFALDPARPNPTSANSIITFALPEPSSVRLRVFSADGALVRELAEGMLPAGEHAINWDGRASGGRPAPAGIYFIRLESRDRIRTQKLAIAR